MTMHRPMPEKRWSVIELIMGQDKMKEDKGIVRSSSRRMRLAADCVNKCGDVFEIVTDIHYDTLPT